MSNSFNSTNLQMVSSYIEDENLNVLICENEEPSSESNDKQQRWVVIANPTTRQIKNIEYFISTNEGFEYPEYTPTQSQLELFKRFVVECP